ncbi:hypothetical protein FE257_011612 [Aspergillus nanangensis]|uniref:Uncharacterized protein n=1 Tax=Aspergillus nanangensis TaxID=2582783 RepID=A0AAD4GWV8_ASPNN|nr:hypothetical protein FE257_011612 [Aspergillus nanangensis]
MTRLINFFIALYALYSLPLVSAWTFTWRNTSNRPTVAKGTSGQSCEEIDQAKGKSFDFDPEDDLVRIYLYGLSNCTGGAIYKAEHSLSRSSNSQIQGFAVIELGGANSSTDGDLQPFPGADWFKSSPSSPIVTAMGKRLVEEGCGKYSQGPGPDWSDSDQKSYQCWQEKLGYSGTDADGWPGAVSWDQLKVPLTVNTEYSTTTGTPSSTSTSASKTTGTATATATATETSATETSTPSGPALSGGGIAGAVVGSVAGIGLVGAIFYFAGRVGRRRYSSASVAEELIEREPEAGGGGHGGDYGQDNADYGAAAAALTGDTKSKEKLPTEAEAIPASRQNTHFAELMGDTKTAELSDSRAINELGDNQRVNELSDSHMVYEMGEGRTMR